MRIFCVRHVRASFNTTRRPKDATSIPPESFMSAAITSEKLPNDLNLIVSSPITRARDTARIIAQKKNLQVDISSLLREIDRPTFILGASYDDEQHQDYMRQRKHAIETCNPNWKYGDGDESFGELKVRAIELKKWAIKQFLGKKLAWISHSNILSMFVGVVRFGENTSDRQLFHGFKTSFLDYGGLAVVNYDEATDIWSLESIEQQIKRR